METVKIKNIDDALLSEVFDIYDDSFPFHERRKRDDYVQAFKDESFKCNAYLNDNKLVGMAFYWETNSFLYLEFLAIKSSARGKNYGSKIINELCDIKEKVILEIEPPIDEPTKKRLNFYSKHGFKINDFDFVHPSFLKEPQPHRLTILSYPNSLTQSEFDEYMMLFDNTVMLYKEK